MQIQVLYFLNTEGQWQLIDPCQGLDFDEMECGQEPLVSLLPTTTLALPVTSHVCWVSLPSFQICL